MARNSAEFSSMFLRFTVAMFFAIPYFLLRGRGAGASGRRLGTLGRVAASDARHRGLADLVPDHVLDDEHLQVHLPVVDLERVVHELGHDRAPARPRPDRRAVARFLLLQDLLHELRVDVWALLE